MTSVTRFLRQLPTGMQYYSLPTSSTSIYEFQPGTGNYVGNYPPGVMVAAADAPALNSWLTTTTGGFTGPYTGGSSALVPGWVMRDMGKTIKAPVKSGSTTGTVEGYFRQFQLLQPKAISSTSTAADNSFGVQGGAATGVPDQYTNFAVVYVPVTVAGLGASAAGVYPIAGGQM